MRYLFLIFIILFMTSCGDSPLYKTQLPNGYSHKSNGGEFGFVDHPAHGLNKFMAHRKDGTEKWCNYFAWKEHLVICKLIEYGDRAFVDEPKSTEYLILDTKTNTSHIFNSLNEAKRYWEQNIGGQVPKLKKFHESTKTWK